MIRHIRNLFVVLAAAAALAAQPITAQAQTSPNWSRGVVPTAAQWNALFASKQDWLGSPPLLLTGGTMTGPLITMPSGTARAGFNLPTGAAPTSPSHGDLWTTSAGLYVRISGSTVGPLTGGSSLSFAATSPLAVTFPGFVVTYGLATAADSTVLANTTGGVAVPSATLLSNAALRAGINYWTLSGSDVYRASGNIGAGAAPTYIVDANVGDNANNKIRLANTTSAGSGQSGSLLAVEVLGARGDGNLTFGGRVGASFRRADGTAIASGVSLGYMAFGGQWGTDTTYQSAKLLYSASIVGVSEGNFTAATVMATGLSFRTGLVGENIITASTTYGTERMRITSAGRVDVIGAMTVGTTINGNTITSASGTLTLDTSTALVASAVPRKVATMAALIAIPASDTSTYYLQGYYAAGDGGEGLFVWNSGSSATADNGVVVNPTGNAGAGRRIRTVYSTVANVAWWGLRCDWNGTTGTSDSAAYQAAIDYLVTVSGGRAMVPRGCRSAIATTIAVQNNNIFLEAEGGPTTRRNGFSTASDCNASLYWTGSASGTIMTYNPITASGNKLTLIGGGVKGLCFYGQGSAGRGLYVRSLISGVWDSLYLESFTSRSMEVGVNILVNTGESCDSQFNLLQNITINNLVPSAETAGHGLVLSGVADNTRANNGCNFSYNILSNINSTTFTGTPILNKGIDNNKWYNIRATRNAGVYGVVYDVSDVAVGPPNVGGAEYWYGLGGSMHVIAGGGIFIYGLDKGNGSPDPVLESGTTASWIDSDMKVSQIHQLSFANILSCSTTLVTSAGGVVSCGGTTYMPIAGGTFTGGIGFSTTNTLDIGTNATTLAPRTVYAGTSFVGPAGTFTTSVAAGGCTIGANAFCANGTANISGNITQGSSSLLLWSTDTNLSRNAAGIVQFGTTAANASGSWLATNGTISGNFIVGAGSALTSTGIGGALGTGAFATIANYAALAGATFTGPVVLSAGTTTNKPLQFQSGPLLTSPLAGTVEFLTDAYYGTITTGAARKTFAFLESPTFTGTPVLSTATATSINKVIITAPATTATLTIANNQTLTVTTGGTLVATAFSTDAANLSGTVAAARLTGSTYTFTSPVLGAATGTSVALGGCAIGTLLFCASGAGGVSPIAELTTQAGGAYGLLRIINTNTNGEASIGFRDNSDSDPTSWVIGKSVGGADLFGFYYGATMMTINTTGQVVITGTVKTGGYTVATLPTPTVGMRAYVTDQLTTCAALGVAVTGGGALTCPVFYNGAAWVGG